MRRARPGVHRPPRRANFAHRTAPGLWPLRVDLRRSAGYRRPPPGTWQIRPANLDIPGAFVVRWCVGSKVETAGGVFHVREEEPTPRIGAGLHRTP